MVIWDVMLYSLVVFHASIFRVAVLKIEAAHSSQTLVPIYNTTWCHIPEDHSFHSYWERSVCFPVTKAGRVALLTCCFV
jgi:hypothetical protein